MNSVHSWPQINLSTLLEEGFLTIKPGSNVISQVQKVFEEGRGFFIQSSAIKGRDFSEGFEGYRGIGQEYSESPSRPDLCESFSARLLNRHKVDKFSPHGRYLHLVMVEGLCSLCEIVNELSMKLETHLTRLPSVRPPFTCEFGSHLQLNYYRPFEHDREVLQDSHEDGLYVTVTKSTAPGLEIKQGEDYRSIHLEPDELFIMPGEIMTLLTGGIVPPLIHRVANHTSCQERLSLMLFANPNPSTRKKLRPWVEADINRDTDIMDLVINNPRRYGLPPLPVVDE